MRSDKVLLALVGVLGIAITGITVGGIIAALRGDPLSPETVALVGTVVGALVGGITGALVPRTEAPVPAEPIGTGEETPGLDQTPPGAPPMADEHLPGSGAPPPSATEAHGGEQWDDVTNEFLK